MITCSIWLFTCRNWLRKGRFNQWHWVLAIRLCLPELLHLLPLLCVERVVYWCSFAFDNVHRFRQFHFRATNPHCNTIIWKFDSIGITNNVQSKSPSVVFFIFTIVLLYCVKVHWDLSEQYNSGEAVDCSLGIGVECSHGWGVPAIVELSSSFSGIFGSFKVWWGNVTSSSSSSSLLLRILRVSSCFFLSLSLFISRCRSTSFGSVSILSCESGSSSVGKTVAGSFMRPVILRPRLLAIVILHQERLHLLDQQAAEGTVGCLLLRPHVQKRNHQEIW